MPRQNCVSLTRQGLQAGAGDDVPHLDGRVGVARDQDIVPQLHPGGQRLVALLTFNGDILKVAHYHFLLCYLHTQFNLMQDLVHAFRISLPKHVAPTLTVFQ